jgi:hypothetical protein
MELRNAVETQFLRSIQRDAALLDKATPFCVLLEKDELFEEYLPL